MSALTRALDPNNLRPFFDALAVLRDTAQSLREDRDFVRVARRTLLPLPFEREQRLDPEPFGPKEPLPLRELSSKRLAVVGSGGSGATASIVGLQRAFEEAGLEPVAISAASGAVLFGVLWASGFDAAAVARFWLELPQRDYVDPDWRALYRSSRRGFEGWAGLMRGEAVERALRKFVGDRRLGDARIPFSMVAWNVDLNRVEHLGTLATPDLPVAVAARIAISIPIFVEPVRVGNHFYGDGGIIDIFPLRPVLEHDPDAILGLNCYLPENFSGEDVTGWRQRRFAILRASGQLRWSGMVALAREQARLAGDKLHLLHPVPYAEVRGARFYETFVDRSRWPHFMQLGRAATREALLALDREAQRPRDAPQLH